MKKLPISLILLLSLNIHTANAQMSVFDPTNAAKQIEIFNQLKQGYDVANKQLEFAKDANKTAQDTLSTIGKATKISVPFVNSQSFDKMLAKNESCLMPDWKKLVPGINFFNPRLPDLCGGRNLYRDNYFIKPNDFNPKTTAEQEKIQNEIRNKRDSLAVDTTEKSLATADIVVQNTTELQSAINELEKSADDAIDQNSRLAVLNKIALLQIRAQNQTNQLLAMLLKQQASFTLRTFPPSIKPSDTPTK